MQHKRLIIAYAAIVCAIIIYFLVLWTTPNMVVSVTGNVVNGFSKLPVTDMINTVNHGSAYAANFTMTEDPAVLLNAETMKTYVGHDFSIIAKNKSRGVINRTHVLLAIDSAVEDAHEMNNTRFAFIFVIDQLIDMKRALNVSDYEQVIEISEIIRQRKERAYYISDSIKILAREIAQEKSKGLEVTLAEVLLQRAMDEFNRELYNEAENSIFQASTALDEARADVTMIEVIAEASKGFFIRNWKNMLGVFIVICLILLLSYNRLRSEWAERRLRKLKAEKKVLADLTKKAQIDHFKKGILPGPTYNVKMDYYRKRLVYIKKEIPVLEAVVKGKSAKTPVSEEKAK
ncbi:hypothetical protein ACFL96_16155 [Thermoproteota archaeon]